jgi:hypothetical protein
MDDGDEEKKTDGIDNIEMNGRDLENDENDSFIPHLHNLQPSTMTPLKGYKYKQI